MSTVRSRPVIGAGVNRVDGPRKVTGAAPYPMDFHVPGQAYAALVQSTIAAGRVIRVDTAAAEASPGVVTVLTHANAPRLERAPVNRLGASPPPPLQDDRILHHGQHIAVVVAETPEQATAAARLVSAEYERTEPLLDLMDPRAPQVDDPWGMDHSRGDAVAALTTAEVTVEETYTTADNTNNPLGPFATLASWDGDHLTVHDTTQWPFVVRSTLATVFGVPESSVRVLAPYVGGGFGAGLRVWPHVILTVAAARVLRRPVKLVLTRPQMFTSVGHRPKSVQRIAVGATRAGDLVGIDHRSISPVAMEDEDYEPIASGTAFAYHCENVLTQDRQAHLNIPNPTSMRAPAEAQGNFALESALDELSYKLGMDPLELRLRNYAEEHPVHSLPWSSKALRECYEVGAERFGWSARTPAPRSMRDGHWLIGLGMAGVSYPWYAADCQAEATVHRDGSALVRSAAADIGTGTYTVMTQLSAECLGLPLERVRFDLGDSDMPAAPQAGGSGLTAALGNAVFDACGRLVKRFAALAARDSESPLYGVAPESVEVTRGRIHPIGQPDRGETYADILGRHDLMELTANGYSKPRSQDELGMALSGAFGAKFVEVRVDADLGLIRVARVLSVIDGGRILNVKTARSQIVGGTVGGIGMALFEDTVTDAPSGRIANGTFGDYLIPVHADVPDLEVVFVGDPDRGSPIGTKGVGEIGLVGVAAAVANAVHHATGKRIRSLPLTLDALL
ncbi:xanthine dehydrogenase family protein molybdopterin-binding subunit [Streptomyces yaanensis]|uniref:Xanthine dehydrogenase family protein molybdopterin-binding subunit n=1 Tax=Streptomyces yaanensis TaxID=1142239 RepID=A0ABV7S7C4_9ACTN|nr:xanthine dehydrogenase family protein molybdopterin-binding subunit [Streptomyces sp. CGMCC 4.7035]WNB99915.1 xanthine dehydrogenase family protein molybdopterin-binding subunit [Streptomyces sp. CGMCC 4.7035]